MTISGALSVTLPAPRRALSSRARERRALMALVALALVTVALLAATANPVIAAAPMLAIVGAYVLARVRLGYAALALVGVSQLVEIAPRGVPDNSPFFWYSPVYPVFYFLSENLDKTTGIQALRFSGLELCYLLLLAVAGARWLAGSRIDTAARQPGARVLYVAMAVAFAAVLWLELVGVARPGADLRQSLWQFRGLLWLPVVTLFLASCMRTAREAAAVAVVVTGATVVKIAIGLYYFITIAWPRGFQPESMTGHEDSVLFVAVAFLWISAFVHKPGTGSLVRVGTLGGAALLALVLNNRRIAFVALLAALFVLYTILRGRMKRALTLAAVYSIPFLFVYLMLGRHRDHGIFKPAALILSVSSQKDNSSATRDIENYNLIQTLKPHQVVGTGWGHEYNELVKAYDISRFFAQYRFIAHNSVLWLLSIGGIVGFALIWMPVPVGIFLAARSYRLADNWRDRTAASTALAILVSYVIQAWGDMGTQGMFSQQVVACAFVVIAKLAHSTGAWPAGVRLFGAPPHAVRLPPAHDGMAA